MDSRNGFHPGHHHHHPHRHHHHHHHHHHFYYISPNCHLHRPILRPINHSPSCSFSTSYPQTQTLEPLALIPPDHDSILQDEIEKLEIDENEEPIFVLTDEWRDFFAKSEAKRRHAKEAKKGKK